METFNQLSVSNCAYFCQKLANETSEISVEMQTFDLDLVDLLFS